MHRRAHHIKSRMQMQIICIRNPIILSTTLFVKPIILYSPCSNGKVTDQSPVMYSPLTVKSPHKV